MISKTLSLYIDTLRKKRKMTVEELVEDIVSLRQYKRYLSGESDIPHRTFVLLSDKLGIDSTRILHDLEEEKQSQMDYINKFYQNVTTYDFVEAAKYIDEDFRNSLLSVSHKKMYDVSLVLMRYYMKKIKKHDCVREIHKLLDYPNIMKIDMLDPVEALILSILTVFTEGDEKENIHYKLYQMLKEPKVTVGPEFFTRQYVLIMVAKAYGQKKDFRKVLQLCKQGLDSAKKRFSYYNNGHLYYYKVLAYSGLNDIEERNKSLKELYNYLVFLQDPKGYDKFDRLITKDFGTPLEHMVDEIKRMEK